LAYVLQSWIEGGPPKQVVPHVIIHCAKMIVSKYILALIRTNLRGGSINEIRLIVIIKEFIIGQERVMNNTPSLLRIDLGVYSPV